MKLAERLGRLKDDNDLICEKLFNLSAMELAILQEVFFLITDNPSADQVKYLEENFTLEQLEDGVKYWCDNRDSSLFIDNETASIIVDELIAYHKADGNHLRYERVDINRDEYRNHIRDRFGLSLI